MQWSTTPPNCATLPRPGDIRRVTRFAIWPTKVDGETRVVWLTRYRQYQEFDWSQKHGRNTWMDLDTHRFSVIG